MSIGMKAALAWRYWNNGFWVAYQGTMSVLNVG